MTNYKLEVYPNLEGLEHAAAERWAAIASEAISDRDKFMAVLSGGDTPLGLYRKLAESPFKERLDWGSMHIFWGDERRVDQNESLSNYFQAWVTLLGRVSIPSDHIHKIQSDIDPEISAANYSKELKLFKSPPLDWPVFDLILLGLGVDGHTASIFPASAFRNTDAVVPAIGRYKDRPSERVTMTPAVINSSREIIFLVNGAEKSAILSRILDGPFDPDLLPAQRIRPSRGNLTWMVDREAARELKNRSV